MYSSLLKHQWKKALRASFFKQNWAVKILLGFLVLYMTASFLVVGVYMPDILEKLNPEAESLTPILSGFILFYLFSDLVMRFFLQDLTVLSVQHYLILPIKKSKVIHFLLQSSVFNFFNLIPLFFLVPWAIRVIPNEYGMLSSLIWFLGMLLLVLSNHYAAIYLKRVLAVKAKVFAIVAVLVALVLIANALGWIPLNEISKTLLEPMASKLWPAVGPLLLMLFLYNRNFRFLIVFTHLDKWQVKAKEVKEGRFSFLESRGIMGTMIANELKLIVRNKRTKVILYVTIFFSLYGLIFYSQEAFQNQYAWLIFVGIFMSGIFMINYGQFLVSWESAYFDGILTRSFSILDYYKAKFLMLAFSCVIMYILTLPYIYFGIKAFYINTACLLYNIGVNTFVLLFASTYNKKAIDLSKGAAFNYQGTSATQFIITLPLMIIPILIFMSFNVFGKPYWGLIALGSAGLISLAFSKYWFQEVINNFKEKKYIKAEGYRQK